MSVRDAPAALTVNAFYRRWPHHARHSGYPRFLDLLPEHVRVRRVTRERVPHVPAGLQRRMVEASGSAHYTPRSAGFELTAARRLWSGRAEVCHFLYGEHDFRHVGRLAPWRRGAIVCTLHLVPELFDELVPDPRVLSAADAVIVVSGQQAARLRGVVADDRVVELRLGVDCDFYTPAAGVPDGEPRAGRAIFVGEHRRDFAMLEAVAERVAVLDPAATVETITSRGRAPALRALPNVRARWGLSDEDLREAYRRADVALMPLRDCTANNALVEAMACGVPVVATDVGGIRSYVDERCAVLVASGDVEGMARATLALMADVDRRARLGEAARQRAIAWNLEAMAERHAEAYQRALDRRRVLAAAAPRPARVRALLP